ncbi:DUF2637 domain-containing protein, partial [Streptomyces sp. NPDC006285]|uniref:DUF2637 domain-containing protein n=1 Tax=Streptomyces sp. NPDC006285 TaxID=3364742 RepID=UPI0036B05409
RIADITADKHMEGVRLTRWLLSPLPTFLLWRRMKLWELRSYEQVIKLEQERLVYQASLRARFGRAWKRKAPVDAMMPLRLARYGVPLAETAPAGLAAAGITEPPILFTIERAPDPAATADPGLEPEPQEPEHEQAPAEPTSTRPQVAPHPADRQPTRPQPQPSPSQEPAQATDERLADAYSEFLARYQTRPTAQQWALWLRDRYGISTGSGEPLSEDQLQPLLGAFQQRYAPTGETAVDEDSQNPDQSWSDYFLSAWHSYAAEYGTYPDADSLAVYVYDRDAITAADGQPITGADLTDFVARFQDRESGWSGPGDDTLADPVEEGEGGQPSPEPEVEPAPEPEVEPEPRTAGVPAQTVKQDRGPRVNRLIDEPSSPASEEVPLTAPDRYYLAWAQYQAEHGREPSTEQLSVYCAQRGLLSRGNRPISPANLRRHFLRWRVYSVWAEQRAHAEVPAHSDVAQACAEQGITGQYGRPITVTYVAEECPDFERRWKALTRHHAATQS